MASCDACGTLVSSGLHSHSKWSVENEDILWICNSCKCFVLQNTWISLPLLHPYTILLYRQVKSTIMISLSLLQRWHWVPGTVLLTMSLTWNDLKEPLVVCPILPIPLPHMSKSALRPQTKTEILSDAAGKRWWVSRLSMYGWHRCAYLILVMRISKAS